MHAIVASTRAVSAAIHNRRGRRGFAVSVHTRCSDVANVVAATYVATHPRIADCWSLGENSRKLHTPTRTSFSGVRLDNSIVIQPGGCSFHRVS